MTGGLEILGLDEHDPRIETDLYPLLRQLRAGLTRRSFDALISEGYAQGLGAAGIPARRVSQRWALGCGCA